MYCCDGELWEPIEVDNLEEKVEGEL